MGASARAFLEMQESDYQEEYLPYEESEEYTEYLKKHEGKKPLFPCGYLTSDTEGSVLFISLWEEFTYDAALSFIERHKHEANRLFVNTQMWHN